MHSAEQDGLLKKYYLNGAVAKQVEERWHANGPQSVSPFVPCASGRIPVALRAARLTSTDVLWDIGCGDGRILHQAAAQYGCTCVGIEIDATCVAEARERAENQGVGHLCTFLCADMMGLEPGRLAGRGGGRRSVMLPSPTLPRTLYECRLSRFSSSRRTVSQGSRATCTASGSAGGCAC